MTHNLQNLIAQAKKTFGRGISDESSLAELKRSMDGLRAKDSDLAARMSSLDRGRGWHSEELFVHTQFRLSLFLLPQGHAIPFHGHPQMTVLLKVLWGHAQIKVFDWAEDYPWTGLARCAYDRSVDGAQEALLVLPKKGNIHRVHAVGDCAFLDLLSPPYSDSDGRFCHYYAEEKTFSLKGETLTRLVRS